MRHLVVCCDGTWNRADEAKDGVPTPTNVRLFHNALAEHHRDGGQQRARYFSGVGADGSLLARAVDGGTGHGLSRNIMNAYRWLTGEYRAGDRISLIGFSRGAYTVRSLAGLLTRCGLLDPGDDPAAPWTDVQRVFREGYARRPPATGWHRGLSFHADFDRPSSEEDVVELGRRIEFIGVWDTVGALGIPDSLGVLDLLDDDEAHRFHDTTLNPGVGRACHALALDERRGPFAPTPWTTPDGEIPPNDDRLTQLWFPGSHCDVGGGFTETGLSHGALAWMIEQAQDGPGLGFRTAARRDIVPDARDVVHDSCVGMYELISPCPRSVPRVVDDAVGVTVHRSAVERMHDAPLAQYPYRPSTLLVVDGPSHTVEVVAREPWNDTGLYLEPGTYTFAAAGEWVDKDTPAGPEGVTDAGVLASLAYRVGSLLGHAEQVLQTVRPAAEMPLSARVDDQRWLSLIGVVADGGFGDPRPGGHDEDITASQVVGRAPKPFLIGTDATITVVRAGYLYAFANDAWGMYANNRGSVWLTVSRTG